MGRIGGMDAELFYGECRCCGCGDLKPRNEIIIGDLKCEPHRVWMRPVRKCEEKEVRN